MRDEARQQCSNWTESTLQYLLLAQCAELESRIKGIVPVTIAQPWCNFISVLAPGSKDPGDCTRTICGLIAVLLSIATPELSLSPLSRLIFCHFVTDELPVKTLPHCNVCCSDAATWK